MSEQDSTPTPRKQRMGARQPQLDPVVAPVQASVEGEATAAPVKRTRMGSQASATLPVQVPEAPKTRSRMGAATAIDALKPSPAVPVQTATQSTNAPGTPRKKVPSSSRGIVTTTVVTIPLIASKVQWKRVLPIIGGVIVLAVVVVVAARWLRTLPDVQGFLETYTGSPTLPESAPTGLAGWMGWQHFFNMFFMVLIVRTGMQVRHEKKAAAYFTPRSKSFFSPKGSTPKKVSISQWIHQALDVFWMLNGLTFIVLLFVTGQWTKIVPTHWDVFPNAVSAGLQYLSLNWPHENGWIHYNALQMIAYFVTVFIAAPLAIISGVRFSTWWPDQNTRLSKVYPVGVARAMHFPVMLYFVGFTIVHVFLVMFTGALKNLNHMYSSRDVADGWGLVIFLASLLVIVAGWFLTKPIFMQPIAEKFGALSK